VGNLTEVGVGRWQRGIIIVEEELRAVGVLTGVSHGDGAALVDDRGVQVLLGSLIGGVFVGELEAGAARAGATGVTALENVDAGGSQTVADHVIVVTLSGEVLDGGDGAGGDGTVECHA